MGLSQGNILHSGMLWLIWDGKPARRLSPAHELHLPFRKRPLSCQSVDEITRRVSVHQTRSDHMGTCRIWALSRLPKIQTDISENTLCWLQQRNHPCRNLALAHDHMVGPDLFKIRDLFV